MECDKEEENSNTNLRSLYASLTVVTVSYKSIYDCSSLSFHGAGLCRFWCDTWAFLDSQATSNFQHIIFSLV
jgi:hypothetical protein